MSHLENEITRVFLTQNDIDSKLECSVCYDDFKLGEEVCKLVCNHVFHTTCIMSWLDLRSTCPMCRRNLGGVNYSDDDVMFLEATISYDEEGTSDEEDVFEFPSDGEDTSPEEYLSDMLVESSDEEMPVAMLSGCEQSSDGEDTYSVILTSDEDDVTDLTIILDSEDPSDEEEFFMLY